MSNDWIPPSNFEEVLKKYLIPPRLYIKILARKELRRGEKELALLKFLTDPSRRSIDVGANNGVYTYLLANYSAEVISFEPNPKIFKILRRVLPANATAHLLALSNVDGEAELRIPRSGRGYTNQGASLSTTKVARDYAPLSVSARRLDSFAFDNVGFIKIDVEGFEREVLEGARATIAKCRPTLLIEIEEIHTKKPIETSIAFIESLGYACLFLSKSGLRSLAQFDPDGNHRHPSYVSDYIFNFIFLPR